MTETPNPTPNGALASLVHAWHWLEHLLTHSTHVALFLIGGFLATVGLMLTVTVYAAPIGVVLMIVGCLLLIRNAYG